MGFAKWYLEVHRGLWWKRKFLPFKTGKKISEKLLFVLLIHLTELQLHLHKPFAKTVLVEFAKSYLEANRSLFWKRNYPKIKLKISFLRNCFVFCQFNSQSYSLPLKKPFAEAVVVKFSKWYLEAHRGLWWKRKYLPLKTGKKLYENLPCVMLIHLTELQLSPQEAFR